MPIITNIICESCRTVEGVAFDSAKETWGDMLSHIVSAGYALSQGVEDQRSINVLSCPRCPGGLEKRQEHL